MGTFGDKFGEAFRNYNTDGVPASGDYEPEKAVIRAIGPALDTALASLAIGIASYPTVAALPTSPVPANGIQARVFSDPTPANNTYWIVKSGAWAIDTDLIADLSAKMLTVTASRSQIKYDGTGAPTPTTQTTTLAAVKVNTTAVVTWTIADLSGAAVTPASSYLSSDTGDSVTMTRVNFDAARGATKGIVITATLSDGVTLSDSATIVANQDGATGAPGADATVSKHLTGYGVPANNFGANGDEYTDLTTSTVYGPKTNGTWPLGAIADVNTPWSHYDLSSSATFPTSLLPWTRAAPSTAVMTNLCYHDAPAATYQAFAAGVPITRPAGALGEGVAIFQTSRNVFLNSTAPVTQNCTVVVGTVIVWSNHDAGVTITTAAGTAVGTGFGAIAPGAPQIITITTAGTISVTKSGSGTWYACQVEYNPIIPTTSVASPLIITAGAAVSRDADSNLTAGALLAQFQSSTGTFQMEVSRVERQTGYGRTPGLLSLATGATYAYISSNTSIGSRGGLAAASLGSQTWDTPQKFAIAWSGSTQSFDAGDRIATADPSAWPAVTAARVGCRDNSTDGQQALCGWVRRIKWRPDRLSDDALFALVSPNRYVGVAANV